MQSVSSRIWTRVAVSISYDDNHYTTGTSSIIDFIVGLYRILNSVEKKECIKIIFVLILCCKFYTYIYLYYEGKNLFVCL